MIDKFPPSLCKVHSDYSEGIFCNHKRERRGHQELTMNENSLYARDRDVGSPIHPQMPFPNEYFKPKICSFKFNFSFKSRFTFTLFNSMRFLYRDGLSVVLNPAVYSLLAARSLLSFLPPALARHPDLHLPSEQTHPTEHSTRQTASINIAI